METLQELYDNFVGVVMEYIGFHRCIPFSSVFFGL